MKKTKISKRVLLIVGVFVLFLSSCERFDGYAGKARFAGSESCKACHPNEYALWKNSDHDYAMDTAVDGTVLGDFDSVVFRHNGFDHRFYRRNGRFFVHTLGPGGQPGDFPVAYTFGYRPLQQYLIPFENGRLQCLPIAWDTEKKRWYHLADSVYPDQEIAPDNWLYWTNNGQNWNGMCAECHSTNLRKNFDPRNNTYRTTWSEIHVGCEACHGPGSEHNRWAALPAWKRPELPNAGLPVQTKNIPAGKQVDQCAYCHSRRMSFGDFIHPRDRLFDLISPQLPVEPFYYADGQIREEDYVYGSFSQSKMHRNKVRCANCHDVHSLKLKKQGNDLCLQCHKASRYDVYEHHFHKTFEEEGDPLVLQGGKKTVAVGEGSLCVNCHMPGTFFMGVDFRRDHSMRIPRPDLSDKLGSPNACIQCHSDKSNAWAAAKTAQWYPDAHSRPHFGETFFAAARGDTASLPALRGLVSDEQSAGIVQASALHYLSAFPTAENREILRARLAHPDPLVRREAVKGFVADDPDDLVRSLFPLLSDSTRMVRQEAFFKLSPFSALLDSLQLRRFDSVKTEYVQAMEYSADFASSRHNLGLLYANLGDWKKAEHNYLQALEIDGEFFPAAVNLAMLYNAQGRNQQAEQLLRQLIRQNPDFEEAYYSLGLLLSEMGRYDEALTFLEEAARRMPQRSRVLFNLYKLQLFRGQTKRAETTLLRCLEMEPSNTQYLYAGIEFYLKQENSSKARQLAKQVLHYHPQTPDRTELEQFLNGSR